jgi:imidazole glycerol-phosphate synthase subunit HisF
VPARRVIPCLDVKDGAVVKGVNFEGLVRVGDPVELAEQYYLDGADEMAFLDISASKEGRATLLSMVERTAERVFIPLLVGGGISTRDGARDVLRAGADKVSVNTAAVERPELIAELADAFGRQCVVISVDAQRSPGPDPKWTVFTHGGSRPTGKDALEWIKAAVALGAGEVLLTSIDRDGTGKGYDLELLQRVTSSVTVPVIASGGASTVTDAAAGVLRGNADAVLAASVFHYGKMTVKEFKEGLRQLGVIVR